MRRVDVVGKKWNGPIGPLVDCEEGWFLVSSRKYEDLFRRGYEGYAIIGWAVGTVALLVMRPPWWWLLILLTMVMAAMRVMQLKRLWSFRFALSLARMRTITLPLLMARSRLQRKKGLLSLGRGFIWSQRHAEIATQILNRNADELPELPGFVLNAVDHLEQTPKNERTSLDKIKATLLENVLPKNSKPVRDSDIGAPWIHGIGIEEEKDMGIPFTSLPGHTLITGTTRAGKAQPLYSKVHTPNGWVRMGEVSQGMSVSTPDGGRAKVLSVFPQGKLKIYRITLEDGRQVDACGNHLWEVYEKERTGKYKLSSEGKAASKILNTEKIIDLMSGGLRDFHIELPKAVYKKRKVTPIDPYFFGSMLTDGFREFSVESWDRHIPIEYKESSIEDRLEVLRGLFDADAVVSRTGAVYYSTSNRTLALDVAEVICSLGGYSVIKERALNIGDKTHGFSYTLSIRFPYPKKLFYCEEKIKIAPEKYKENGHDLRIKIQNIEECGFEEAQCILIDHHRHLYITDGYIVTHNTRLYELITAQIVDMGAALIVIDPKKDIDWVSMLKLQCRLTGRKFLYFDPAQPSKSIRLQPLQNWNGKSEPATRIGQLVDADGSFAAFAWKTLYRVHRALIAAGERPTIRNTKRYVQMGVEGLAEKVLTIHFLEKHGPDWDRDLKNMPASAMSGGGGKNSAPLTRLDWCIAKYLQEGDTDDTIEGIVSMVKHSKEHYSKMVQVLEPILEMLGSDEIGDLLSPDPQDLSDTRPIYDMRRVIDEKAVLYIGLDSLSNKIIASAIGSILLADLSSTLGAIYNFSQPTDAYLFVDEVAEVANDQLIQILNKGGGAGIKAFLAMQSIADLTVRLGSKDKCEQVLANLNNILSLRIRSAETAKYVSDLFGEVQTRQLEVSYSSGSGSSDSFTEFRSNTSRSLKAETGALVSSALLMRLPPLHFFAFLAGRGIYKGVLEFIEAKREAP